jgi:hypothetical protein
MKSLINTPVSQKKTGPVTVVVLKHTETNRYPLVIKSGWRITNKTGG